MLAAPGGRYRLSIKLGGAVGNDLSWLVAALRATYGGIEVERAARTRGDGATVVVRTSRRAPIDVGDRVTPVLEGLTTTGLQLPEATIEQVTPLAVPPVQRALELSEPDLVGGGWGMADVAKLGLSALLIGATVYLVSRGGAG